MYQVESDILAAAIEGYCRMWRMLLDGGASGAFIMSDMITDARSTLQSTSISDDIEIGAICSGSWTVTLTGVDDSLLGTELDVYLYLEDPDDPGFPLEYELVPTAKMTCVKSLKRGASTEITLADKLYFSDRLYTPSDSITYPTTGRAIEDDICAQLGMVNGNDYTSKPYLFDLNGKRLFDSQSLRLRSAPFDFEIAKKDMPKEVTYRQMLSYIASAHGQFGYVDRFGRYMRKWYGSSVKTLDPNTIDLPTLSEQQNIVTGIYCKVGELEGEPLAFSFGDITGATGRVLEFENPLMTEELLQSLWHRIKGTSWHTTELYHRLGDPRFDIGDVVTYEGSEQTYDIPITSLDYTFDGGLAANITAAGISVEEQIEPV